MKDRDLKDLLFRHYWAQRYFVQPEVEIYYAGGTEGSRKLVTDVDIYALRAHPDLRFERVLGDCRTLKGQSPIARALWLRGLAAFLGATTGMILLDTPAIEADHKLAAEELGILLMTGKDFRIYDRAIVYPAGAAEQVDVSVTDIVALGEVSRRFPAFEALTQYLYHRAFQEPWSGPLLRHVIGQLRGVAKELDPGRPEHLVAFCDASAVFAVGVAECSGRVFHQYLQPEQKSLLSDALKTIIWGGQEQYAFYQSVRQKMLDAVRHSDVNPGPELPEWNLFMQLVRNILERPAASFHVPWMLRQYAVCLLRGADVAKYVRREDLLTVKFAMLVLDYTCKAVSVPSDFADRIVGPLVSLQSKLATAAPELTVVHGSASPAPSKAIS